MPRTSYKQEMIELIQRSTMLEYGFAICDKERDEILDFSMDMMELAYAYRYWQPRQAKLVTSPSNTLWFSKILPGLDDAQFKEQLRITRHQFQDLMELMGGDDLFKTAGSRNQKPVDLQLAVVLYRFGHGNTASVNQIATKFGIGDGGSLKIITDRVVKVILKQHKMYVRWPCLRERDELTKMVADKMPGCVGSVVSSLIKLSDCKRQYLDGLHIQIVADHNHRIRHVVVGGTTEANRENEVFKDCAIGLHPERYLSAGQWLAADSVYKPSKYLVTPFDRNSPEVLAEKRKLFNETLSQIHVTVKQTFEVLKEKFQSLKDLRIKVDKPEKHIAACQWIEACCILHNMFLLEDDLAPYHEAPFEDAKPRNKRFKYDSDEDLPDTDDRRLHLINIISRNM